MKAYEIQSGKAFRIPQQGHLPSRGTVYVHNVNFPDGRYGVVEVRGSWRSRDNVVATVRLDPDRHIVPCI